MPTQLSHLDVLEAESIHIFREVAAEFEKPVLLFSGGKDSIVMLRLAEKAFWPARIPFPVMHVDTGHNFARGARLPRPTGRRARRAAGGGVGAGVDRRRAGGRGDRARGPAATGCRRSRCSTPSPSNGFDAVFGGGRRDEEKARAKERVYSFRDDFGQWDPKNQRPELWNLYNGRHRKGEHIRVFPLSNWTELDIWQYIEGRRHRDPVDLLRAPARGVPPRRHVAGGVAVRHADGRRGAGRDDWCATARSATRRAPVRSSRRRRRSTT